MRSQAALAVVKSVSEHVGVHAGVEAEVVVVDVMQREAS